jgi:uncharacterized protein involved in outer membrane biogenesis
VPGVFWLSACATLDGEERTLRNVLVAIASLVIVLLGVLAAAPHVVDWDAWRGSLEEEATRVLGRDVRVGGKVRIGFLPSPTFALETVRVADVEANAGEALFRAEAVTGSLAIAPLFRGILQANEIVLSRPQLHIVLDENGGGNWSTLGQGGRLPFALDAVALDAVRIQGGQVSVYGPDRVERLHLDAIDGELSAAAVDGPFRFRGTFGAEGARREVRFASTKRDGDGSLRFKAALKHLDTQAVYNFDARALDLTRAPRVEGELSALVPVPRSDGRAGADEAPVEIKATLAAGARAVNLSNLTVAFERKGRPQILTGITDVALTAPVTVDVTLAARWLDLDQIIGAVPAGAAEVSVAGIAEGPIADLLRLATRLNGFTPEAGRTKLALDVEQATLGREPVSGLRLRLSSQGVETDIKDLRIGLPGGARADVTGLMTGMGEETAFDGTVVVRGASLARFISWSSVNRLTLDAARDGPFAMRARLVAAPGRIEAREFVGDVAGTTVQGELGYRAGPRPEVSVLIEGAQVDLRPVLPEPTEPGGASSLMGALIHATAAHPMAKGVDGVLRIRSGQVVLPGARYQDVAADLEWREARIRVTQMRFAAPHGVTVDLRGDMPAQSTGQSGALVGTVTAADVAGVRLLGDIFAIPPNVLPADHVVAAMVPLRLAGRATFSAGADAALTVEADGDVDGSQVRGRAALAQGLARWRNAALDLSGAFSGARATTILAALTGTDPIPAPDGARAQITVDAVGVPATGMTGRVAYDAGAGHLELNGRFNDPGNGAPFAFEGDVKLKAARAADVLAIIGPKGPWTTIGDAAIAGTAAVVRRGSDLRLDQIIMRVNQADVRGQLAISQVGSQATVAGGLSVSTLPADAVLSWATLPTTRALAAAQDLSQGGDRVWSRALIDRKATAALEGRISVHAAELVLPAGPTLREARFVFDARGDRIDISDITGAGGGGRWSGGISLKLGTDMPTATVALRAVDVDLVDLHGQRDAARGPAGRFSGVVTMSGRGVSVADIVASLSGRGTITAEATRIPVLAPSAVATAIDAAVRGPAEAQPTTLRRMVREAAAAATPIDVPPRAVTVDVRSGLLAAQPIAADTGDGRITASLTLDLASLRLAVEWHAIAAATAMPPVEWQPVGTAANKVTAVPFPAVVGTAAGPLVTLGTMTATWNTEALERDLVVRRAERDAAILAVRRQEDEARALEEAERRSPPLSGPATSTAPSPLPPAEPAAAVPASPSPRQVRPAPLPKPAARPWSEEDRRRIFGGG